jgi:hypothetical protein
MAIGRIGKTALGVAAGALLSAAGFLSYNAVGTHAMIGGNIERVFATARSPTPPRLAEPDLARLYRPKSTSNCFRRQI